MTHGIPVLGELVVLAAIALAVVMLFRRVRLPAAIGFIATGVMAGPGGLGLIGDPELVRTLAEFGVVLLLFTVGLELSLQDLGRIGRFGFLAGALQIVLTMALVAGILVAVGLHPARAIFFGLLLALSSTALVLKLLSDRLELTSPHGRLVTGILVIQDLMVVPCAIVVPWLGRWVGREDLIAGPGATSPSAVAAAAPAGVGGWRSFIVLAVVAIAFLLARRAAPWILARVARARSPEAFLFGVVLVALGGAWLTSWAGLSLALGAFLGGLILARSDLKSRIAADVLPFREAFSSVFFITIGMQLMPRLLVDQPLLVLASTVGLVGAKLGGALVAMRLARVPWRVAFASALCLAQVGEFSFVLAQAGQPHGLLGAIGGQAFFAGAVFSLMLTPLLVERAPELALALGRRIAGGGEAPEGAAPEDGDVPPPTSHVVIAGFGLNGRNVARVLRAVRIPHLIVDLDADALQAAVAEGSRALVGDIANPHIQKHAGVPGARVLVLALSDPTATRHACHLARTLSRNVHIIVRTRYVSEIDELHRLGANQIIPEEFETSIEIFTATLREFHVPANVIQAQIRLLRQERYSLLRGMKLPGSVVEQLDAILTQGTCDTFLLLQHSPAIGRTLKEMSLVGGGSAQAVAVVRGGNAIIFFDDDFRLRVGDTLVLAGTHGGMEEMFQRLSPPAELEEAPAT
ncbi:MAG TPA: cation:proton antiporter [Candidatus Eisenbacteria bacterium]|nr:cation:proton antiporter [Candidatus Eisenbacteria bacterium]